MKAEAVPEVTTREESAPVTSSAATDARDEESKELDAEQRRLEEEKAAWEKQKALDEKKRKIEEERERLEAEKEARRQAEPEREKSQKNYAYAPSTPLSVRTNIVGNWIVSFEYQGTEYRHDILIVDQKEDGSINGRGGYPAGGTTYSFAWVITSGLVTKNNVDFVADYTIGAPGTTMHVAGEIDQSGSIVGTWTDNYFGINRRGTFRARR